jgi:hypothetical protein
MGQFGTGYWIIVAAEVMLLFGGLQVLRLLDAPSQTVSPGWSWWWESRHRPGPAG